MQLGTIAATSPIPLFVHDDSEVLTKPSNATRELSLNVWSLFVDSTMWEYERNDQTQQLSTNLKHKDGDAYICIVYYPMQTIGDDFVASFVKALESEPGCTATLVSRRITNINGVNATDVVVKYDCNDVPIIYNNIYYSDPKGTLVLTSWTSDSSYETLRHDIRKALSGLIKRTS